MRERWTWWRSEIDGRERWGTMGQQGATTPVAARGGEMGRAGNGAAMAKGGKVGSDVSGVGVSHFAFRSCSGVQAGRGVSAICCDGLVLSEEATSSQKRAVGSEQRFDSVSGQDGLPGGRFSRAWRTPLHLDPCPRSP